MDSGALFLALLTGHLLGDWVVQTDWMAAFKSWSPGRSAEIAADATRGDTRRARRLWWESIRANQAHCLTYHLAMAIAVLPVWHSWGTVAGFAVSWVSHGFIDRRWPVRALLRATGSPAFAEQMWGVIATDQALHLSILAMVALLAT